jgi:serine/threonine protein kinase
MEHDNDRRYETSTLDVIADMAHWPVGHVLLQNMDLFIPMGLRDPLEQRLGKGTFGHAYEVPLRGSTVLKLTRDPTEIQASMLLLGRPSKRIVHIYGAWAVKGTFGEELRGWYAVHRELLSPLSKRDTALVETIFQVYDDTSLDLTIPRSTKQHAMVNKWRGWLRAEMMEGTAVPIDDEGSMVGSMGSGKLVQRAVMLLLQIGQGVDELHKAGVDWEDIHPGNIMRNAGGKLVIADVGWGLMHEDFDREIPFLSTASLRGYLDAADAIEAPGAAKL